MAVKGEFDSIETFSDWYGDYRISQHDGTLEYTGFSPCASKKYQYYQYFKREHEARTEGYEKYEKMADAAVVTERTDLPNISSGEAAGFLRRIARNVVQHTPNITVSSIYDDDSSYGVLAAWIAKSKIVRDDQYSNHMQQQLYATAIRAFALGFDCVIPALLQDARGSWYTQYDQINYRDVFPEPGTKDIRRATSVYVRRYLTRGEVHGLIRSNAAGWDHTALKSLLQTSPISREYTDHQSKKHSVNSEAYEVITLYTNTGEPFLTWSENMKFLLRIEKNKHPLKEHPVFFFVPEYDGEQPFGRSLISLIYGRQEFQDWFLNGAMKLWRLNIEPPIIGYGVVNVTPNIGPGKYTGIPNPNAKIEAFSVDSSTLTMFDRIAGNNSANMGQLIGAADQQMASQGTGGMMSQTPQGVDAQQQMVDVVTNNYQKAMESFFSQYLSYALTVYFEELKGTKFLMPSADARKQLINGGIAPEKFIHSDYTETTKDPETGAETTRTVTHAQAHGEDCKLKDGQIKVDFADLCVEWFVKAIPGSLTELEDEKQSRMLQDILVSISQALPAIAQAQDQRFLQNTAATIQFIMQKLIEISGSAHSSQLKEIMQNGQSPQLQEWEDRTNTLESNLSGAQSELASTVGQMVQVMGQMAENQKTQREALETIAGSLGVQIPSSAPETPETETAAPVGAY